MESPENLFANSSTNSSVAPVDYSAFLEALLQNRRVDTAAYYALIASYCLLIIVGTSGNLLVVYAVARKPAMRTPRNVFIINLAVSDLLLCLITMPLTLMEILSRHWPLGDSPLTCKMVGGMQAVSIFVSTMSITAIALDRYQIIVYPTQGSFQKAGALGVLAAVWVVSTILAVPLFIWRTLKEVPIPFEGFPLQAVHYCIEEWPFEHGRILFSAGSVLFQYALPIVTVSIAHARICQKLRFRLTSLAQMGKDSRKQAQEDQRLRKTNTLLMAIALIFGICWMPLNIYNIVLDLCNPFGGDTESMLVIYAVCHMFGMSSACANPLLYGWLNDNFRKEFQEIGSSILCRPPTESASRSSALPNCTRLDNDITLAQHPEPAIKPDNPRRESAKLAEVTLVTHCNAAETGNRRSPVLL